MTIKHEYCTMRRTEDGSVDVIGWGTYPESSVLAGQASKTYLDNFPTEEEARAMYPAITGFSSKWTEPVNTFNHLPGEEDFVADGAYLDDY